jgi:hypothetical protein
VDAQVPHGGEPPCFGVPISCGHRYWPMLVTGMQQWVQPRRPILCTATTEATCSQAGTAAIRCATLRNKGGDLLPLVACVWRSRKKSAGPVVGGDGPAPLDRLDLFIGAATSHSHDQEPGSLHPTSRGGHGGRNSLLPDRVVDGNISGAGKVRVINHQ